MSCALAVGCDGEEEEAEGVRGLEVDASRGCNRAIACARVRDANMLRMTGINYQDDVKKNNGSGHPRADQQLLL